MPMEIKVIQVGFPTTVNPTGSWETSSKEIVENVYERLVDYPTSSTEDVSPMLADYWIISEDCIDYIFHIRDQVFFHNGKRLTAHSVVDSLSETLLQTNGQTAILRKVIKSIEMIDSAHVRISLRTAFSRFLHLLTLTGASIVDRPDEDNSFGPFRYPVGTGPFKLGSIVEGKSIELIRNDNYWRCPAKLSRIYINYEDSLEIRKAALIKGDADIIHYNPNHLRDLIDAPEYIYETNQSFDMMIIGLNLRHKPLSNRYFRYALAHIFDYEDFIQTARNGFAKRIRGPIPHGLWGCSDNVLTFNYNEHLAKCYLDQSGIMGSRNRTLSLLYVEGLEDRAYGLKVLQRGLKKINIESKIIALPWREFLNALRDGKFDCAFLSIVPDYPDPHTFIESLAHSQGSTATYIGYKNDEIDKLVDMNFWEQSKDRRISILHDIQKIITEDAPYLWISQAIDIKVHRKDIIGIVYSPYFSDYYYYPLEKKDYAKSQ